jgi:hypothetical protein
MVHHSNLMREAVDMEEVAAKKIYNATIMSSSIRLGSEKFVCGEFIL